MDKHDADRINAAFTDFARKQECDRAKIVALEKAIQSQGQLIQMMQDQIRSLNIREANNGHYNRLDNEGNIHSS